MRAIAGADAPMTEEEIAATGNVSPRLDGLMAGLRELTALRVLERDGDAYAINRELRASA